MLRMFRRTHFEHGQVWAITEPALRSLMQAAAEKDVSIEAIARDWGKEAEGAYEARIHDGVAVIPVYGALLRHLTFWGWLTGSSAYEVIGRDFAAVIANPEVRTVAFDIDSPGGLVTGVSELAELIKRLRAEHGKPVIAYASGMCASAAYWIASACDEIFVSPTSPVGSIGCVATIRDYSAAEQKLGIREFVSSVSPAKRSDPATDEGAARIQAQVDALGAVFVEAVAKNRAVSNSTVLKDFGQGDCLVGEAAVTAGLADGIGTLEDVIAEFGNRAQAPAHGDDDMLKRGAKALTKTSQSIAAKAKAEETEEEAEEDEEDASEEEDETARAEDDEEESGEDDEEDTDASDDEEEDSAEDEEEEPKSKKAKASGERGRIAAILNSPHAKGRSALAKHLALDTGLSPKAAARILQAAPKASGAAAAKAKGNGFDAAMKALGNPKVGTGKAAATEADKGAAAIADAAKLIGLAK